MTIYVPYQPPRTRPCHIAFVAEAPSDEELEKGAPLVGPSGRIFNALLRTAGIDRYDCLVTNVFNEKIPENKVKNWCVPLGRARELGITDLPPIGDAGFLEGPYRHHLARLTQELMEWRPTVIVPLGGTALWALTGETGISARRGSVVAATRLMAGSKLLPTFHPAALMHQWKFYHVVVGDLIRAAKEASRGPGIILPIRNLTVEPTLEEIHDYLPRLLSSDLLSVDIETGWGQITCIGFAPDASNALCIPFLDKRVPSRNYWPTAIEETIAWRAVERVLTSPVPKLGQNFGAYDAYWILEKMRIGVRNLTHDTRLLHHALYPELPKSLEFMGASYGTQGMWKGWGKKSEKKDD